MSECSSGAVDCQTERVFLAPRDIVRESAQFRGERAGERAWLVGSWRQHDARVKQPVRNSRAKGRGHSDGRLRDPRQKRQGREETSAVHSDTVAPRHSSRGNAGIARAALSIRA